MKPADRKLLNKLRAESRQGQAEAVEHRQDLRLRARISQEIGAMLRELRVDPAQTRLAEFGGGAAAELAAIPDTPELQRADEAFEAAQPDDDEEEDPRHVLAGELDRTVPENRAMKPSREIPLHSRCILQRSRHRALLQVGPTPSCGAS